MFYLPLCVGIFFAIDDVRMFIEHGTIGIENPILDRVLLIVVSIEVFTLAIAFIIGMPLVVMLRVLERRRHFIWSEDSEKDGIEGRGRWFWKPHDDMRHIRIDDLFEMESRLKHAREILDTLPALAKWPSTVNRLRSILPSFVGRNLLPSENVIRHGRALASNITKDTLVVADIWTLGIGQYDEDRGNETGINELWTCLKPNFILWNVYASFVEKYLLYAFANNLFSSVVQPDTCANLGAQDTDGSGSSQEMDFQERVLSELRSDEVPLECQKIGNAGMMFVVVAGFLFDVIAKPHIDAREGRIEALCRFSNISMICVISLLIYDVQVETHILVAMLIVPAIAVLVYAIYVINPGLLVEHIGNEITMFFEKRKVGKELYKKAKAKHNLLLYQAAKAGKTAELRECVIKFSAELDLNWQNQIEGEEAGFTAIRKCSDVVNHTSY